MANIFEDGAKIEFRRDSKGDRMLALVDGKALGEVEAIEPGTFREDKAFGTAVIRVYLRNVTITDEH